MSIKVMTWAWDLPLPGNEKLLLLSLADYVNDDGFGAWPSIARLQERTTADRRTVQRNLRKLEERGLIKTEHREGRSNDYVINMDVEVGGGKMPPPDEDPWGAAPTPQGGRHPRRPGGGTHAAQSVNEPPENHQGVLLPPPAQPPASPSQIANRLARDYCDRNPAAPFQQARVAITAALKQFDEAVIGAAIGRIEAGAASHVTQGTLLREIHEINRYDYSKINWDEV